MEYEIVIKNNVVYRKAISEVEYCTVEKFIKDNISVAIPAYISPPLPNNLMFFRIIEDYVDYFVNIPSGVYNLKYKTSSLKIPLPEQMFVFRTKNNQIIKHKYLWNFDKDFKNMDSSTWEIPYISNVYSKGKICTGDITGASDLATAINKFIEFFFDKPFNDDLLKTPFFRLNRVSEEALKMLNEGTEEKDLYKVWTHLLDKEVFDIENSDDYNNEMSNLNEMEFERWVLQMI